MSIYTDPTVSYIMRNLADGLAEFNAKAEAALSQSTQSLAVPSESAASEPTAGECPSPKSKPGAPLEFGVGQDEEE